MEKKKKKKNIHLLEVTLFPTKVPGYRTGTVLVEYVRFTSIILQYTGRCTYVLMSFYSIRNKYADTYMYVLISTVHTYRT